MGVVGALNIHLYCLEYETIELTKKVGMVIIMEKLATIKSAIIMHNLH